MKQETKMIIDTAIEAANKRSRTAKSYSFVRTAIRQAVGYGSFRQKFVNVGAQTVGVVAQKMIPAFGTLLAVAFKRAGELGQIKMAEKLELTPWRGIVDNATAHKKYAENALENVQQQREMLDGLVDAIFKLENAHANFVEKYNHYIERLNMVHDGKIAAYMASQGKGQASPHKFDNDLDNLRFYAKICAEAYAHYLHRAARLRFYADRVQDFVSVTQELASIHDDSIEKITGQFTDTIDHEVNMRIVVSRL
ncbi:MAG: hypothetical protein BWK79_00285 [Beggiatoa sp. IS2]|nr:MAG: hypothetical protein BWK79_00285 [Beggiatoa sp. IS2]